MYFNASAIAISLGVLSWAVNALPQSSTSSATSVNITACPPQAISEEGQRANWNAFVEDFYFNGQVAEAFDNYVWIDYIQHDPSFAQGRDAAVTALEHLVAAGGLPQIEHYGFDNSTGWIHQYASVGGVQVKIVDVYRLDGSCIVEHWDVRANLTTAEINPAVLATPTPVPVYP
jgi:predicted SnoaL-like aldol condensation-catalyzing enzyme